MPIAEAPEEEKLADIRVTGGAVKGPLINAEVNIYKLELDKGEIHEFNAALNKWLELLKENEVTIQSDKLTAGSIPVPTIIENLQATLPQYGFTTELKQLKKNIADATNFADANTLVMNYLGSEETNDKVLKQIESIKETAATLTDYKTGIKAIESLTDKLEEAESFSAAQSLLLDYRANEKAAPDNLGKTPKLDGFDAAIASLEAYSAKANAFGLSAIRHAFKNDIYDIFLQRFDIQNNAISRQNILDLDAALTTADTVESAKESLEKGFDKEVNLDLKSALSLLIAKITTLDDFKFDILGRETLYHNYYTDAENFLQPKGIPNPTDNDLLEEIQKVNSLFSANLEPALRKAFINEELNENEVKQNLLSFGVTNEQGLLPGLIVGEYRGFVYMEVKSLAKTVDLSSGKAPIFSKFESIFHTDTILGSGEADGDDRTVYFILNGQVQRDSDGKLISDRQDIAATGSSELLEIRPTFLATPLTSLGLGVTIEKFKSLAPFLSDANLDSIPDRYLSNSLLKTSLQSASDLLIESLGIGMSHNQNIFHDASIRLPEMKYFAYEELAAIQHRLSIENFSAFVQALRARTNLSGLDILDLLREDLSDNQLDGNVFSKVIEDFSSIPEYKFLLLSDPSEKFLPDTNIPVSNIFYVMNDELTTTQPEHELSEFTSKRSDMVIDAAKGGLDTDADGVFDNEDQFPADQNKSRDLSPGYTGIWSIGFDGSEYAYMPFKNDFVFSLNKEVIQGACSSIPCMGLGDLSASITAEYSLIQAPEKHDFTYQAFDSNASIGFTAFATVPGDYLVKARFITPDASREPPIQAYEIIIPIQVIDPKTIELRFNPETPVPGKKVEVEFKATKGLCALYSFCDELNIDLDDNLTDPDFINIAYLADIYSVSQTIIRDSKKLGFTSVDSIENNNESSNLSNLRLNDKLSVSVTFSAGSREFIAKSTDSDAGGTTDSDSDGVADTDDIFPNDANCSLEKDGILDTNLDGEVNNLDSPTCFASFIAEATIELDVPFLNETWHYRAISEDEPDSDDKPAWHYIVREKKYESGFNGLIKLPTLSGTKHSIPSDKHFIVDDVAKRVYFAYKNAAIDYFSLESQEVNSFISSKAFNSINSLHLIGTYLLVEYGIDANSFEGILYNVDGNIAQIKGAGNFPKPLAPITLEIDGLNFLSATQNRLEIDWQLERGSPDSIIPVELSNDKVTLLSGQTLFGDVIKLNFTFTTSDSREIQINQTLFVLNVDDIKFTEDTFFDDQPLNISLLNFDESVLSDNNQKLFVNWSKNDENEQDFRFVFRDPSYPFILEASNFLYGDMIKAEVLLKHGEKELLVKQLNAVVLGNLIEILPVVDASKTEVDIANLNAHFELKKPSTNDDFFTAETFLPVWRINGAIIKGENGLTFPELDTTSFSYGDRISVSYTININGQTLQTDTTLVGELSVLSTSSQFELTPKVAEMGHDISLLTTSFTDEALAELAPFWRINSEVDKTETGFTYPSDKLNYGDFVELLLVFQGGKIENAFSHIAEASVGLNLSSLQNQVSDPEHDLDSDQDGVPNHQDYFRYDTNCSVISAGQPDDLDGDGIPDLEELSLFGTNPNKSDTDNDGVNDWDEVNVSSTNSFITNPLSSDTDGDGYKDGVEIDIGSDPLDPLSPNAIPADNDFDGLPNEEELLAGTKVNVFDTDADGLSDWFERNNIIPNHISPNKTQELNADSDGDGLSDGLEVRITKTDPLKPDTDGDGLSDGLEILLGLNPLVVDSNNNGVDDNDEPDFDFNQQLTDILYIPDLPNYTVVQDHRKTIPAGTCFNTFIAEHKPQQVAYSHVSQVTSLSEQQVAFSSSDWAQVVRYDATNKQYLPSIDLSDYINVELTALEYAYRYENGNNNSDLNHLYLGFSDGTIRVFDAQEIEPNQITDLFVAEENFAVTKLLDQGTFLLAEQVTENGQIVHTAFNKTSKNTVKWNADYSYAQSVWLDSKREHLVIVDAEHDSNLFIREQFNSALANPLINVVQINATSALTGPVFVETIEGNELLRFGSGHAYNLTGNAWLSQQLAPFSYGVSHQSHRVLALKNSSLLEMTTSSTINGENFWRFTTQLDQPEFISVIPVGFHLLAISAKQPKLNVPSEIAFQSIILGDEDGNDLPDWWQRLSSSLTLADFNSYQLTNDVAIPDFLNGDPDIDDTVTAPVLVDTDGDGICDHWEVNLFGTDPSSTDSDGDGASDAQELGITLQNPLDCDVMPEFNIVSDPLITDTDNDGLSDGDELFVHFTKPLFADFDNDGLSDFQEITIFGSNPNLDDSNNDGTLDGDIDSDGDGLSDAEELNRYNTNHLDSDTDLDGLTDFEEVIIYGSNPNDADTDGDSLSDFDEIRIHGTNPGKLDTDGDGLSDDFELNLDAENPFSSSPTIVDTDGDGLSDFEESVFEFEYASNMDGFVNEAITTLNPNQKDTDGDGICDIWEVTLFNSNPAEVDTDFDNLNDPVELGIVVDLNVEVDCTNPPQFTPISNVLIRDTDEDGILDGDEVNKLFTDPKDTDSDDNGITDDKEDFDGDGLNNAQELYLTKTEPFNADTNGNSIIDSLDDQDDDKLTDIFEINTSKTDPLLSDTNGNGIDDKTEFERGWDPVLEDTDGDGLSDVFEFETKYAEYGNRTTDPLNPDTDGDGVNDGDELNRVPPTEPLNPDTDHDFLSDGVEIEDGVLGPLNHDTDEDGIPDGIEVRYLNTDPLDLDSDNDDIPDADEVWVFAFEVAPAADPLAAPVLTDILLKVGVLNNKVVLNSKRNHPRWPFPQAFAANGKDRLVFDLFDMSDATKIIGRLFIQRFSDPTKSDSDGDGLSDKTEFAIETAYGNGFDLTHSSDTFSALLSNADNFKVSDPWNIDSNASKDTDGDGLPDWYEIKASLTDPLKADSDDNGIPDGQENPDADLLNNLQEMRFGSDPHVSDGIDELAVLPAFDTDGDGLPDLYEITVFNTSPFLVDSDGNGVSDADEDSDSDGLSNIQVLSLSTNPILAGLPAYDTDGDGLPDLYEIRAFNTSPTLVDTDGNGISDADEDPDNDGLSNLVEIRLGLNPLVADADTLIRDSDNDGLVDHIELLITFTNPRESDTNGNGISDYDEDADNDGLSNSLELLLGSDPTVRNISVDTDGDGLTDFQETAITLTDINLLDSNSNGILDGNEDFDGDSLSNIQEMLLNNDPYVVDILDSQEDVDGDLLINLLDQNNQETDVLNSDTDGDGILDGIEVLILGTNPNQADTDGDGIADSDEAGVVPEKFIREVANNETCFEYETRLSSVAGKDYCTLVNSNLNPPLTDSNNDGIPDGYEVGVNHLNNIREIATNETCLDTETRLSDIAGKDYCISVSFNSFPTISDSDNDGTPDGMVNADSSVTLDHFPLDATCHNQTDGFENLELGREQCFASWMSDFESLDFIKSVEWLTSASEKRAEVIFHSQGWDKVVRYNILSETYSAPAPVDTDETVIAIDAVGQTKSLFIFYTSGKVDRFDLEADTTQTIGAFAEPGLSPSSLLAIDSGEFILQFVDANNQSSLYLYDQNGVLLDSLLGLQVDIGGALVKCASDNCDSTGEIYSFVVDASGVKTNLARIDLDLQSKTFGSLTTSNTLSQFTELKGPIRLSESDDKIYLGSGQILKLNLDLPDSEQPQDLSITHFGKTYSEFYDFTVSSGHFVGVIDYDLSGIPGAPSEPATQNGFIVKDLSSPNQYLLPPITLEERILSLLPYEIASIPETVIEIAIVSRLKDRILIEKFGASDQDKDGMPGIYEKFYGLNDEDPTDKFEDPDFDDLVNIEEYMYGTDPLSGKFEDPDNDGLMNIEEFQYGTNPMKKDTDDDGRDDLEEIRNETDPLDRLDY